jgi:hypothetical protein
LAGDWKAAGVGETSMLTTVGDKWKGNNWKGNNWKGNNWKGNKYYYGYGPRVRYWKHQPYYGQFIGGVVLGTILGVGAIGVAPPPPGPEFCWYWVDPSMTRGYWDYCQ